MKRNYIRLLLLTLLVAVMLVGVGLVFYSLGGYQISLEFIKVWAAAVFILLIGFDIAVFIFLISFDIFIVWDSWL
ncbi:hypothetical protein [Oscillibacter sp. MSJ-31]|uniref:hypothetical protein n=1 Tax=Oscillibacter sp. MSJ-31 TaxID=2841526 RepID=UPI001C11A0A2|nr:hypothetical protein [Oscillibacter sp. MSJ-31]MBU5457548.1 hypothetical protein [Oscillibacter sp. MSJ-31]